VLLYQIILAFKTKMQFKIRRLHKETVITSVNMS